MKIKEVLDNLDKNKDMLKKSFIDREGNVYCTEGLHEDLAIDICEKKGWDWYNYRKYASEYLLFEKCFIKVADYDLCGDGYHYVAYAGKNMIVKEIMKKEAGKIAKALNVELFEEEET